MSGMWRGRSLEDYDKDQLIQIISDLAEYYEGRISMLKGAMK